jgi:chromosomal replication initiator protein
MEPTPVQVWEKCLSNVENRINHQSFCTWLKPTRALGWEEDSLLVGVPNNFVADWLKRHYRDMLNDSLAGITSPPRKVMFRITSNAPGIEEEQPVQPAEDEPRPAVSAARRPVLNPRYTFDTFVVGESNEFSHAASMAVAESPGETRFNPLFIYGGVGLGKTHLIQGIGHFIAETQPAMRVLYATSEKFTNDFISSLSTHTTSEFTNLYRSVDVLLLDDIQFFTGKESTQVQFFHTFNALHQDGKQIVLTSDRPPRDIRGLEERLLSRFQWGLVTDIQPPDFETRMAILKKKMQPEEANIPDDVLAYIASNVRSNIRELEGSLIRLLAFASLRQQTINLPLAESILKDTLSSKEQAVTIDTIITKVAAYFDVTEEVLRSKKKTQEVALARQVAMYLARTLTQMSLKAIGGYFSGRDHSTVIHSVNLVRAALKIDPHLKYKVDTVINMLYHPPVV